MLITPLCYAQEDKDTTINQGNRPYLPQTLINENNPEVINKKEKKQTTDKDDIIYYEGDKKVKGKKIRVMPTDSSQIHSVKKATLYSLILPGLGQAYNKKYWKIPIVYAALGATTFLAIENHNLYKTYLDGFYTVHNSNGAITTFEGQTGADLIELQNIYRKQRDLSILVGALAYALNILDAHVDAHLYYYNLSEDLSVSWEPGLYQTPLLGNNNVGLSLKFNF